MKFNSLTILNKTFCNLVFFQTFCLPPCGEIVNCCFKCFFAGIGLKLHSVQFFEVLSVYAFLLLVYGLESQEVCVVSYCSTTILLSGGFL